MPDPLPDGTLPGFQSTDTTPSEVIPSVPLQHVPDPGTTSGGLSSVLTGGVTPSVQMGFNTHISCPAFTITDPLPSVSCFVRAQIAYAGVNIIAGAFVLFGLYLLFKPEADAAAKIGAGAAGDAVKVGTSAAAAVATEGASIPAEGAAEGAAVAGKTAQKVAKVAKTAAAAKAAKAEPPAEEAKK